jgi:hypothetical protein
LCCVESSSLLAETLLFTNFAEHFSATVEMHYQEYLLFSLKGVLQVNQKRMAD